MCVIMANVERKKNVEENESEKNEKNSIFGADAKVKSKRSIHHVNKNKSNTLKQIKYAQQSR